MYHGPREGVLPFFESQGFACPERKGVADFLQEVGAVPAARRCALLSRELAVFFLGVADFLQEVGG